MLCQTSPWWPICLAWPLIAWLFAFSWIRLWSIWSDWLVFGDCGSSLSALWCPVYTYHLPWVSLVLDVGYLFMAAPAKFSHCLLPCMWTIYSWPPLLTLDLGHLLSAAPALCSCCRTYIHTQRYLILEKNNNLSVKQPAKWLNKEWKISYYDIEQLMKHIHIVISICIEIRQIFLMYSNWSKLQNSKKKLFVKTNKILMHVYSCKHHSIDLDGHVVKGGMLQLFCLHLLVQ